jgi:putative transposase
MGIAPSIGNIGDAHANSLMETIIGVYKAECIRKGPFHTDP